MGSRLNEYRVFWREFRQTFHTTGAVLPSGRSLCKALASQVGRDEVARRVLEVGPGTGAVTNEIIRRLGPNDRLDLVELNARFAAVLRERFANEKHWQEVASRTRVLETADRAASPRRKIRVHHFRLATQQFLLRLCRPGARPISINSPAKVAHLVSLNTSPIRKVKALVSSASERERLLGIEKLLQDGVRRLGIQPAVRARQCPASLGSSLTVCQDAASQRSDPPNSAGDELTVVRILTIETTCDETAAAVVTDKLEVLGAVVASQSHLHKDYGGVVPEIASRAHVERILPVIEQTLSQAKVTLAELDAIAVANQPGLAGSLLVGLIAAKSLSLACDLPLIAIDHLQAHIYACRIASRSRSLSLRGLDRQRRAFESLSLRKCPRFHSLGKHHRRCGRRGLRQSRQHVGAGLSRWARDPTRRRKGRPKEVSLASATSR